jgi:hypothetical protein
VVGALRAALAAEPSLEKQIPALGPAPEQLLGENANALVKVLVERIQKQLEVHWEAEGDVVISGGLIGWIDASQMNVDDTDAYCYTVPHVDQANVPTYEFSTILYLNNSAAPDTNGGGADCVDEKAGQFEGGHFAFNDSTGDLLVAPRRGRLLAFTSGPENLHQVYPVTSGNRFTLAVWFSRRSNGASEDADERGGGEGGAAGGIWAAAAAFVAVGAMAMVWANSRGDEEEGSA